VDLLLEDAVRSSTNQDGLVVAHSNAALAPNVEAAEKVFRLLDLMPVEEPAADLMARTFARISSAVGVRVEPPAHREHRPQA
jgi:hypothetical protein